MKNIILLLTTIVLSNSIVSQLPNKSLASKNLKQTVKEVNKNVYYYRSSQNSYVLSSKSKEEFSKEGLLLKQYSKFSNLNTEHKYNYEYKAGKIVKHMDETFDTKSREVRSEKSTNYLYNSGNLTEIKSMGINPTTIKFDYNKENQVTKETKVGLGGKLIYEKSYVYTRKNKYSITSYFYSKGVKGKNPDIYYYENGKLVSTKFNSFGTSSVYAYSYNDNGDKISYYYKGKLNKEYFYVYDKHNNWIVKIEKTYNSYKKSYSYTYSFREINYKRGSSGSIEMDENLVKKYEKRESYKIKLYKSSSSEYSKILANPDTVKEMLVLKTQGSKFKVKTGKGNYLTNKVNAIKHTNGLDMIVYHPKSNTTALIKDFNDELFKRDIWRKAEIVSSTDSIFWNVNEKGNWYIIVKGKPYSKYETTNLKYSTENPDDVIVYINKAATYIMKNFRNAAHHKLYPLRKL